MPPSQKKSRKSPLQPDNSTLDAKTSSKIMSLARAQQQELQDPDQPALPSTPYARGPRISALNEEDPPEWEDYESLQGAYDALASFI